MAETDDRAKVCAGSGTLAPLSQLSGGLGSSIPSPRFAPEEPAGVPPHASRPDEHEEKAQAALEAAHDAGFTEAISIQWRDLVECDVATLTEEAREVRRLLVLAAGVAATNAANVHTPDVGIAASTEAVEMLGTSTHTVAPPLDPAAPIRVGLPAEKRLCIEVIAERDEARRERDVALAKVAAERAARHAALADLATATDALEVVTAEAAAMREALADGAQAHEPCAGADCWCVEARAALSTSASSAFLARLRALEEVAEAATKAVTWSRTDYGQALRTALDRLAALGATKAGVESPGKAGA